MRYPPACPPPLRRINQLPSADGKQAKPAAGQAAAAAPAAPPPEALKSRRGSAASTLPGGGGGKGAPLAATAAGPANGGGGPVVADRAEPGRLADDHVYALVWDAVLVADLVETAAAAAAAAAASGGAASPSEDSYPPGGGPDRSSTTSFLPATSPSPGPPLESASSAVITAGASLSSARSSMSGGVSAGGAVAALAAPTAPPPADGKAAGPALLSARSINVKRAEATDKAAAASAALTGAALQAMSKPSAAWVTVAPMAAREGGRLSDGEAASVARSGHALVVLPLPSSSSAIDGERGGSAGATAAMLVIGGAAHASFGPRQLQHSQQPAPATLLQFMTPTALQELRSTSARDGGAASAVSRASSAASAALVDASGAALPEYLFEGEGSYIGEVAGDDGAAPPVRQGRGRMAFLSGDVYLGQWHADMHEGEGEMTYADGRRYSGGWRGGVFHGQGVCSWPSPGRASAAEAAEALRALCRGDAAVDLSGWSMADYSGSWMQVRPMVRVAACCCF